MAKQPRRDAFLRALRQVSNAAKLSIERGKSGLAAFNALRKQFPNVPRDWLSQGYQLGKQLAGAVDAFGRASPGKPFFLKDIPTLRGLDTGDSIDNRILYRFTARIRPKYSRVPRTLTIDVASNVALSPLEAYDLARRQLRQTYAEYPNRRGGRPVDEFTEVDLELTYIARGY